MDKNIRTIDETFAEAFRKDSLFKLYKENSNELFLGIRGGYINLYHLCNSIAKVSVTRKGIRSEINSYYIDGLQKDNYDSDTIVRMYNTIRARSKERSKLEKQAQQTMAMMNNANPESNWYCLDVEYEKSNMAGRFDLVAISKKEPHRVALIELKYGSKAYGGSSGILTHVKDFKAFLENGNYEILKKDIASIIASQKLLDVDIPNSLRNLDAKDLSTEPEFYFITVNNNPVKKGAATPQQTMAGYLFKKENPKYKEWNCRKHSVNAVEDILEFDITNTSSPFHASLLFTNQDIVSLDIDDIIDGKYDIRIYPE